MFLSFAEFPSQPPFSSKLVNVGGRSAVEHAVEGDGLFRLLPCMWSLPCCHEENKCLMILEKDFAIGCPAVEGRRGRVIARR